MMRLDMVNHNPNLDILMGWYFEKMRKDFFELDCCLIVEVVELFDQLTKALHYCVD